MGINLKMGSLPSMVIVTDGGYPFYMTVLSSRGSNVTPPFALLLHCCPFGSLYSRQYDLPSRKPLYDHIKDRYTGGISTPNQIAG